MSSRCRSAAAIIARSIAVAMKRHGGERLALIRLPQPVRSGSRRIRSQRRNRRLEAPTARPPKPLAVLLSLSPPVLRPTKRSLFLK